MTVTEGMPFMYPAVRMFCAESMTSATSERRTASAVVVADDQGPVFVGLGDLVVGEDVGGDHRHWRSARAAMSEFCRLSSDWTLGHA